MLTKWLAEMRKRIYPLWVERVESSLPPKDISIEEAYRKGFRDGYWGGVEDTILAGQESKPQTISYDV